MYVIWYVKYIMFNFTYTYLTILMSCLCIIYIYIHAKLFLYFFIPFVSFPLLHKTSTCGLQPQCTKRLHRYHEHCWTAHRTGNSTFPPFKNLGMDQSLYFLYKFGWIGGMHIHHFLTQSAKTKTHIQYQHIQTYVYVYIYIYTYTYIYMYYWKKPIWQKVHATGAMAYEWIFLQ